MAQILNTSGASSEEDLAPFPTPEVSTITLEGKRSAKLAYTYYPPSESSSQHANPFAQTLVVFLNGLMLPRESWNASIDSFLHKRINAHLPFPALLAYDRYGQGDSDHDPDDKEPPPSHGHDCMSAVHSLRQFLLQIWKEHLDISNPTHFPALILVCNSIGCAIARLFAATYPGTVSGMLFLDSVVANSDFVSLWPDPDAEDFNQNALPPGVTEQDLRGTRERTYRMFHPSQPNNENLSRRNLGMLLPDASAPKVEGYRGDGPYLTVVGHDWETFAEQTETGAMRTKQALTMTYINPAWQKYNEGLTKITDEGKAIGPVIAVGCGHFIQRDGPGFVSDEMVSLLDRVVNQLEQFREKDRGHIAPPGSNSVVSSSAFAGQM